MNEAFLHYIWQFRLFNTENLITDEGQTIRILNTGSLNTGSGPDFFNARIKLGDTLWAGNVEIHINASDWSRHNHHTDLAYDSCILHVVYNNDGPTKRMNNTSIPTIELKNRFADYLWENYLQMLGTKGWIPCQHRLKEVDKSVWENTLKELVLERLEQRSDQILISLNGHRGDWNENFYQYLAKNFGFQLNAMPFEMLARSLPLKIINREKGNLLNVEALLFGQAGMLSENSDELYMQRLYQTYIHLSSKYGLRNIPFSSWKFLRLRPVNFPALRIAQFASLLFQSHSVLDSLIHTPGIKEWSALFKVHASEYWDEHYHFKNKSVPGIKRIGNSSIHNILINTCAPFLYAWGKYNGEKTASQRALELLLEIPAEENNLIQRWQEIGAPVNSARDTQALLQLKILHCSEKKCLSCHIGKHLISHLPMP